MRAGEAFSPHQSSEISKACREAREASGLHFSVFVGRSSTDPGVETPVPLDAAAVRTFARMLHAALGDRADSSVLVHVDPGARRVEIVTGAVARRHLDDRACGLASLSMASSFAGGDLFGGIMTGVRMLAQSVAQPV